MNPAAVCAGARSWRSSPIVVALASMQLAPRLAARVGARLPIAAGMALPAAGMVLLAQLGAESSYLTGVVPGLVVMSLGLGCVTGLAMGAATFGVARADAGVAGAGAHGYTTAFWWSAALPAVGAVLSWLLIESRSAQASLPTATPRRPSRSWPTDPTPTTPTRKRPT
jgi:hypothetical protein